MNSNKVKIYQNFLIPTNLFAIITKEFDIFSLAFLRF